MGKGDKKSRRGKIIRGTYGVRRHRKADKDSIKPREVVTPQRPVKEKKEKARTEIKESGVKENVFEKTTVKPEKSEKPAKAEKETKAVKEPKAAKEPKPKKEKKE